MQIVYQAASLFQLSANVIEQRVEHSLLKQRKEEGVRITRFTMVKQGPG